MRLSRLVHIALAMAVGGFAGAASAQITVVNSDVTTPTTWCDNEDTMFLEVPIFVSSKLTIEPGCIIRGNPRTVAFNPGSPTVGAPGALIISQDGFLDAQGSALNPIIMTTGASDGNNDGIPDDDDSNGFADGWNGTDAFLDDTPLTNPLAPLDAAGSQTAGLWGGVVILGRAPTNLADSATFGYGRTGVEGLAVPGFPPEGAVYGGYQPHDSSGILRYVSVRHAGDEIGEGNELNGITLGGVGDGTILENVEVYANQDDGLEWFGGTVNARNVALIAIGDDSLDIDQGFTGNVQNALVVQTFFNENDAELFGAESGDNAGEWDGDDCDPCNIQLDTNADAPAFAVSFPNAHPAIYNMTILGADDEDTNNPAVSPAVGTRGIRPRDGWSGAVVNSIFNNIAGSACQVENDALLVASEYGNSIKAVDAGDPELIRIVASTFVDSGAPNANCLTAIADGDAAVTAGEYDGGSANVTGLTGEILVNDNYFFDPQGVAVSGRGKLQGSKVGAPADPRPASPGDANVSGGVRPRGAGLDPTATYRGAFPASQPLWLDGWSLLCTGGILDCD